MAKTENQEEGLPQHRCGADRDGSHPSGSSLWMKSLHRNRMAKLMTRCFSRVSEDWRQQDSKRVMEILERLVYRSVDTDLLLRNRVLHAGMAFQFHVVENVYSDELFDLLLEYHPDKWRIIQDAFQENGPVDIVYEDRYLNSPLGCILLAQFIRRIGFQFHLSFRSIRIVVSKRDFHKSADDNTQRLFQRFSCPENRDRFLRLCMDVILGRPYDLEVRNVGHTRSLAIANGTYELDIRPEGGISHGWGIDYGDFHMLTVEGIGNDVDINVPCFNQLSHELGNKGIPYVVEFMPAVKKS